MTAEPELALRAFVSASGSAGTLGAGDHLKEEYGAKVVAVEALECPTMLRNGFGAHNIQGIGDKHIPLIHHVHNTDVVVAVTRPGDRPALSALRRPRAVWSTSVTGAASRTPCSPACRRSACPASAT